MNITIDDEEKEITPYYPEPYRSGNKVVSSYDLPFTDRAGNNAMITYVDYINKKGKLIEKYVMFIKWSNL
tara:strand:- start:1752 stop:1961 length:210 start_codon:yes stop_codon:yes gene_type:complete